MAVRAAGELVAESSPVVQCAVNMEAATWAHAWAQMHGLMHGPIGMGYPTMPVAPRRAPAILFPVSFEASTLS